MSVVFQTSLRIETSSGQGLYEVTPTVASTVATSGIQAGTCHVFIQHTSCSLVIQENADPSARHDLEQWITRLAPENDPLYTHTFEGSDDMPARLRSAVTNTSETIPVVNGQLGLGTWQGLYVWEHRRRGHQRKLVVTVMGR